MTGDSEIAEAFRRFEELIRPGHERRASREQIVAMISEDRTSPAP